MDKNDILQMEFEDLIENYDKEDSISVEDTIFAMSTRWRDYMEAGCDIDQIWKMMAPEDVWENYDELTSHGANIDFADIMFDMLCDIDSFVKENWDKLEERGFKEEDLVNLLDIEYFDAIFFLMEKKVELKTILERSKECLNCLFEDGWGDDLLEVMQALRQYGLSADEMNKMVNQTNYGIYFVESAVDDSYEEWKELGLEITDSMIDGWLYADGDFCLEDGLEGLPKPITLEKILSYYSIKELTSIYGGDFWGFYEDYTSSGVHGDEDALAEKIVKEDVSYNYDVTLVILDMVAHGIGIKRFDLKKLFDAVKSYGFEIDEQLYDDLKKAGVDEALIKSCVS